VRLDAAFRGRCRIESTLDGRVAVKDEVPAWCSRRAGRTTRRPPGSTRVVVTLHAQNGGTRVVLCHFDLAAHDQAGHDQRDHHGKGWELYLGRLGCTIQGDDPGPDPGT
jgi:hypothetical protein